MCLFKQLYRLAVYNENPDTADRWVQLYSMVSKGTYNQPAISSLDTETFFSAIQVTIPFHAYILKWIARNLSVGLPTLAVFIDLSKAFDTIYRPHIIDSPPVLN